MATTTTEAAAAAPAATDVLEERMIDAEYKIWKKNTPFLYEYVMTHSLEWPSLTCQWLPHMRQLGTEAEEHSLLLGTHTTGEQNYLMVATCALPHDDDVVEDPPTAADNRKPAPQYDEEKKEVGGFGHGNNTVGKIEIKMKIKHEGEVNRARYMPQNHFIVASRGPNPEVYIFDRSKHPSIPQANDPFSPQGVCIGHTDEGYGLVWSTHQEGYLCTASADQTVKVWDVAACTAAKATPGTQIHPIVSLEKVHTAAVQDVDWHKHDANMIASVGDDKQLVLWDMRKPAETIHVVKEAHKDDINTVAFNPMNEFLVATGSSDNEIAVWDLRKLTSRLQTLQGHTNDVFRIEWAPHNESILGSCSADRRVAVWDLSRIGMEQSPEDAEDGPPELLFLHGGHTSKVADFSWSPVAEWGVASVSEDNVLQVWHMAEDIYAEEDAEENDGKKDNGALGDDDLE